MSKLDELKAAYEAATPGEWEANGFGICSLGTPLTKRAGVATVTGSGLTDEYAHHTAQFIALAHNNMAALLEAVELARVAFEVYMANGQSEEPSAMNSMRDLEQALEKLK